MGLLAALLIAAVLLIVGVVVRAGVPLLRRIFVPASVVGGIVGLVVAGFWQGLVGQTETLDGVLGQFRDWPGFLIAVVFGGMLLSPGRGGGEGVSGGLSAVGREGVMVWVIGLGQTAMGCLLVWLVLSPGFGAAAELAVLIETGFIGGHGTAASMGEVLLRVDPPVENGLALGTLVATFGLIYGVVSGVGWVNLGVRRGWLAKPVEAMVDREETGNVDERVSTDQTTDLDPWLLQAIYLCFAVAIGYAIQMAAVWVGEQTSVLTLLKDLPLFIYTLAGGWVVKLLLIAGGYGWTIDSRILARQTGIAMDVLVVAAIASLDLKGVVSDLPVVAVLCGGGAVWTGVCLLVLSRRILPASHWFELGLLNYGMSTGTTATGFVLLRMVDPELRTDAAKDYALAAPISSPFIGGGMITFALPILVLGRVPVGVVTVVLWLIVSGFIATGMVMQRRS